MTEVLVSFYCQLQNCNRPIANEIILTALASNNTIPPPQVQLLTPLPGKSQQRPGMDGSKGILRDGVSELETYIGS